jgi:hypothetical protein
VAGILQQAPVEDEATYEAANPAKDGKVVFDSTLNEAREDAIVRNMMKTAKTAILVLGGAHDLGDNVLSSHFETPSPSTTAMHFKIRGDRKAGE